MARKVTFVADVTGPNFTPLSEIPKEVKDLVEEAYAKIRKTNGRVRVEYDNADELAQDFRLMAAYCAQRTAGVLKIRRSPTRNLPDNVMDFRVTADIEANGQKAGDGKARTHA